MTSAQVHTTVGSKGNISETFDFILEFEKFFDTIEDRTQDAVSSTISEETQVLRDTLGNHPDWSPMKDSAEVRLEDGMLAYRVEDPRAMDIEYGNPQKKIVATGLLRSTAVSRSQDVTESIMNKIIGGLQDA